MASQNREYKAKDQLQVGNLMGGALTLSLVESFQVLHFGIRESGNKLAFLFRKLFRKIPFLKP